MKLRFITQMQLVKSRNDKMAQKLLMEYELLRTNVELKELLTKYADAEKILKSKSSELKSNMLRAITEGNEAICALDPNSMEESGLLSKGIAPIHVFPSELILNCSLPDKAPATLRSDLLRSKGKKELADFSDIEAFLRMYGIYFLDNFPSFLVRDQALVENLIVSINKDLSIFGLPDYIFWPFATTSKVRNFLNSVTSKEYCLVAKKMEVRFLARIKMINEDLNTLSELTQKLSRFDLPRLGEI